MIKPGDGVLHKPSGEKWLVASMSRDGRELACSGWPETIANTRDCTLVRSATPEQEIDELKAVAISADGLRSSWARHNLLALGVNGFVESECSYCRGTGRTTVWKGVPE